MATTVADSANAQSNGKGASDRQSVRKSFEQKAPALGEPLPDLTAYDSDGHQFHLRRLKGNYTVLVFGCLT